MAAYTRRRFNLALAYTYTCKKNAAAFRSDAFAITTRGQDATALFPLAASDKTKHTSNTREADTYGY